MLLPRVVMRSARCCGEGNISAKRKTPYSCAWINFTLHSTTPPPPHLVFAFAEFSTFLVKRLTHICEAFVHPPVTVTALSFWF